jgi:hypothetical protein
MAVRQATHTARPAKGPESIPHAWTRIRSNLQELIEGFLQLGL